MKKLPFVVEPRLKSIIEKIGSEEAGYIEIERKGYLTAGEKSFVQQVQQADSGTIQLITLAREISTKKSITLEEGYNALLETLSGNIKTKLAKDVTLEFATEIQGVITGLANSKLREDLVYAACMLTYRIDPDLDIKDIAELHPDIINGLAELYRDEENKSISRLKEAADEQEAPVIDLEEVEKKQE